MDVDDPAAREDLVELVALQLVVAGAAAHHHGLDVEIVERVGHAVEEHAVVRDHLLGLVELAAAALRIAAAQVPWRQHRLHARMPEHRLRGQAHLREQALRPAPWEVEDRLGFRVGRLRVANDRHVVRILDVEQRARRLLRQVARHLLVDEVDHLFLERRHTQRGRRRAGLLLREAAQQVVGQALRLESDAHHARAHRLDGLRIGRVQEEHRCRVAGTEALLPHLAQQVAHVHRHVAEIDLHRAGREALVAHRAVVGHVLELFPVLDADAAPGLLFIEEGLDQQRGREDLVARAVEQVGARHVRGAHRLALAAAQAVLHAVGDGTDVALLHDQRLVPHEAEARRVGIGQVGVQRDRFAGGRAQQLALVEAALGVDAGLVFGKGAQLFVAEEFELRDADAVLARDHAVEAARQRHDAHHRGMRGLQHVVVVAVHGDVGVHVAVTRVHVQRDPHAALEHALVDGRAFGQDRRELGTREDLLQRLAQLRLPARAQAMVLQLREQRIDVLEPTGPQRPHLVHQRHSLCHAVFEELRGGNFVRVVGLAQRQVATREEHFELVGQRELVLQRQLDVDALDAVAVLGHARQRDHHVFVDLEGVGVLADGGRALAVEPEFLARLGADGDEAFAAARIGDAHHLGGDARHSIGVVTRDVAEQHHLRQAAVLLRFGGVADSLEIAVVQVLEASQQNARALLLGEHEVLDLDDAGHRVLGIAKEFEAHGARVRRHLVHHPAAAGDEAVAALLLDARQTREELVGHVLAEAFLAEGAAGNVEALGAQLGLAVGRKVLQLEQGALGVVDLAQVVADARDFEPLSLRRDHAPRGEVVECGAPQHGLLSASVHRDVAADARGLRRGRVDCEHEARALGRIGHALRNDAGFGPDGGHGLVETGQRHVLDLGHRLELLGVDDDAVPGQRNGAAGVAGAAPARNDGQAQLDAALHQERHLGLGVGAQHDKGVLHAPVGRVGHVRYAGEPVELDVVLGGEPAQHACGLAAQCRDVAELGVEGGDRVANQRGELADQLVARHVAVGGAALLDFGQAVLERLDQLAAAARVVQQVVDEIGVALHHPDVAQHFVEHAGRSAGAALGAQGLEQFPAAFAQQANHDLAIGEAGVVIWDLAQSDRLCGLCQQRVQRGRSIHRVGRLGRALRAHSRAGDFRTGLGVLPRGASVVLVLGAARPARRSAQPAQFRTARGCGSSRQPSRASPARGRKMPRRCPSPRSRPSRSSAGTARRC